MRTTPYVQNQLSHIKDTRIQEQIRKRISALANDPDKQGKLLGDDLIGLRSVRAVKERYRIIFNVEEDKVVVLIMLVGIRKEGDKKDVYAMARKLMRLGLLDLVTPATPDSNEQQPTVSEGPEGGEQPQSTTEI